MNASNNRTVSGGHLPLLKCLIPAGSKRTKIEKKKKKVEEETASLATKMVLPLKEGVNPPLKLQPQ